MKHVGCLSLIAVCFDLIGIKIYANSEAYIPLIKEIRSQYSSSAVFTLYSTESADVDGMIVMHLTHTWCRTLEREQIGTVTLPVKDMHVLAKYYDNSRRQLIVFFLFGPSGYYEFSQKTATLKMSSFVWLVIFIPTPGALRNCYAPRGNPFHLSFDTEMLVVCFKDPIIHEWYSLDGNSTEISKLAYWYPNANDSSQSVEMLTQLSLYQRRNDLKGKVLRGIIVKGSILLTYKDKRFYGYLSAVIEELQNVLNFTLEIVTEESEYGSFNSTTNNWSGAMNYIATGKLDIGLSDFAMTNNRLNYVDYLVPIITSRSCLYLKQSEMFSVKWFAYFKAFSFSVWKSLFVVFIIAQITVAFIRSCVESRDIIHAMFEEFLRVLGIICQQGLTEFPRNTSLRIAYYTMLITAIVVTAAYSASLICFLAACVRDRPFQTIDELIEDGTFGIILLKGSAEYDMFANSKDPTSVKIMKMLRPSNTLPRNIESGFKRICNEQNLAFYCGYNLRIQKIAMNVQIPCKVSCIGFDRVTSVSLILPKDSQYTEALNYYVQKLLNSGLLNRFKNEMAYEEENSFQPVAFGSVVSVLLVFTSGAILAILLLLVEICYDKCRSIKNFERSRSVR